LLTGTAIAVTFAGVANLAVAFAGDSNRNFQKAGLIGAGNVQLSGGGLAPAILDTSQGPAHLTLTFSVHRYAGPGHKPYNTTIDMDLVLHVRHVLHIAGVSDAGFVAGDPGLPATAGHPAFDDAYLGSLARNSSAPQHLVQSPPIGTPQKFHVHFDPLPNNTPADIVAGKVVNLSFPITIPKCGYYDVETGAYTANTPINPGSGSGGGSTSCTCPPPHSTPGNGQSATGDYFSVLTRVFVRAVSSTCSSTQPISSTLGVSASVPAAGAGPGFAPAIVTLGTRDTAENLYVGFLLLGFGMIMIAMTTGYRRALSLGNIRTQ